MGRYDALDRSTKTMPTERYTPLAHLRAYRTRPDRDTSIAAAVRDEAARVEQQRRASAKSDNAWDQLAPDHLRPRARFTSLLRGTLTLKARDAAARFEIDRWLRAGGETALLRRAGARRVKVV